MAYIQGKVKKIVSFKFKACVGQDADGKQVFKCKTRYPPDELTPAKAHKDAQKVAALWAYEAREAYLKEQREPVVTGCSPSRPFTFDGFVNDVWLPLYVRDGSHRPSTIAMHTNILRVILPQFEGIPLSDISGVYISQYLRRLRTDHRKYTMDVLLFWRN